MEGKTMLVDLEDGRCRTCGSQLEVTGANDCSLDVQCANPECCDGCRVEPDAFGDGGIKYWPEATVEFGEEL